MEDELNQKIKELKFRLLENRTDDFCNQLNGIMLAVELLQLSSNQWNEVDKQYFEWIKNAIDNLATSIRSYPTFLRFDEDYLRDYLDNLDLVWWIEILTNSPRFTYYFGPFVTAQEAELAKDGYIEDLEKKGSQVLTVQIQQRQSNFLTLFEHELTKNSEWGAIQVLNP